MKDPHNPEDWQPGDRLTFYPAVMPFQLQTVEGVVYVEPGTYGRFVMTSEGWAVDNRD